jgi:hypothetical protein
MEYSDIDEILNRRGISDDPAFKDVVVNINPIGLDPSGRAALGLYFPKESTIVLPPTLDPAKDSLGETVALHELAHRHGHYYYNDLSEQYAENQSQKWQGRMEYHDIFGEPDDVIKSMEVVRMMPSLVTPCKVCKAPESTCPYCEYGGVKVDLAYDRDFKVFATVGDFDGTIDLVEIMYKGVVVTKVPANEKFSIRAHVKTHFAQNADWTVLMTVAEIPINTPVANEPIAANTGLYLNFDRDVKSSVGGTIHDWNGWKDLIVKTGVAGVGGTDSGGLFTMPATGLKLRVKLWCYPGSAGVADLPATTLW